ncbi:hypothetical protein SJAV_18920 [Sulfurisphaera javensis]|uniref:Thioredoxin domain-containing protein n=1 Tax=Sulfurisphaera javensis TaxID=2049879 RepID=A0AAT9GSU3_9CREN
MNFLSWNQAIYKNKELIALFMITSWCEYCEEQEKEFDFEINDKVSLVKEDADERIDLAVRYTPQIYPCISLIAKDSVIGGTYGLVKKDKIKEMVNDALELISGKGKIITPPEISHKVDKFTPNYALNHILRVCEGYFDWKEGGFEKEPKYVSPEVLQLFLHFNDYYHKLMVEVTLDNAIEYLWDNGFYLFSKTIDWKEPYKAKLLDYNAEMVRTLLKAYEVVKDDTYLDYAIKTIEWILKKKDNQGYFINSEFLGKEDKRPFLNVNSNVGNALIEAYKFTEDEKYIEEAKELSDKLVISHRIDTLTPPYLIDIASYLSFLSKLDINKAKRLSVILQDYKGDKAYYDVTLNYAKENLIGRYHFLYDNTLLAEAFMNLGFIDEAKKIIDSFLASYGIYTYYNQAKYAIILGELYGLFTH